MPTPPEERHDDEDVHRHQRQVDWMALSLRSREIILQVGFHLTAGYSYEEIAVRLTEQRPEFRHLELPQKVTKGWVQARFREVRREIEAQ